jgi:hypothetical protein
MIYLYAIVETGARPPACSGIDDEPLEVVLLGGVAALCSTHPQRPLSPEPELIWRHDLVLERAMAGGPVLPVRFGTTFADATALQAALAGKETGFRAQLGELRGYVELAVRVSLPEEWRQAPAEGRAYLENRLALRRELEAATQGVLAPLESFARDSRRLARIAGEPFIKASYLVSTGEVDRFAAEVRRLGGSSGDLQVSCTGPWAPYSFVGEEAA